MSYGIKIKHLRVKKNMNQQDLSNGICSISYLSKIENNVVKPNREIIDLLCEKLGITLHELQTEEELLLKMKCELTELNYLIRRKETNIVFKFNEILKRYEALNSPQANVIKLIFELRITLLSLDRIKLTDIYNRVIENLDYKPNWIEPYYYMFCGLFHYMIGSLEQALSFYKKAEKCVQTDKEEVYYQLALVYSRLGNFSLSTLYLNRAYDIFVQKMDYELCTSCNLLLGINYRKMGELQKSKENYFKITQNLSPKRDKETLGKVYHNLGLIYSDEGDSTKSIFFYKKSLKVKKADSKINTLYVLSREYVKLKDFKSAKKWNELGINSAIKQKSENHLIMFNVLNYEINNKLNTHDFENYMINVAIPFFEKRQERQTLSEYVHKMAIYYENIRQYKNSYLMLKKLTHFKEGETIK
ncbi:helix-turn-helix transcriptional regulator [Virgibacillus litoralis]|uniref:Tetratricopeptide (TPR) repeat protein n=1 Tax=Virgibacillus litoralis TaxID=578221 RepID=A0ABS4HEK1_9BACI|nr:helix-turn-helix transcriptional regulator [Virgibacillus litoralis]MBP1949336.1 tetratricopeptide (TPR) repeat protein [Virgibacillus litoralis]